MWELRPMRSDDISDVAALEAMHQPTPWTEGVLTDELEAPGRIYVVAEDGRLRGYGGMMIIGDEGHVTNLFVEPESRGKGLATTILQALKSSAINSGARHLTLEVRAANQEAIRLYAKMGLRPVGVRPGYYGDEDALVMWAHDIDRSEIKESLS